MTHLKCSACRVRLVVAPPHDPPETCPECSGSLQSVERPSELIGFRRFDVTAASSQASSDACARLAGAVAQAMPHPDAAVAETSLAPESWFSDNRRNDP